MNVEPYKDKVMNWFHAAPISEKRIQNNPVLEVKNLSFSYENSAKVLNDINYTINKGEMIIPLLFSTMERIDVVSNAMALRGFGKKNKRTWYAKRPLKRNDFIVITLTILFTAIALIYTYYDGSRFYNPFI